MREMVTSPSRWLACHGEILVEEYMIISTRDDERNMGSWLSVLLMAPPLSRSTHTTQLMHMHAHISTYIYCIRDMGLDCCDACLIYPCTTIHTNLAVYTVILPTSQIIRSQIIRCFSFLGYITLLLCILIYTVSRCIVEPIYLKTKS